MRWHYRDAALVWLFPLSYALHILEEWFGGFPEWVALVAGAALPRPAFIAINVIAMAMMVLAARAAIAHEKWGWTATAIATVLFVNGLAHIIGSLVTRGYSPGLFTGVVLYLPIGQLALWRAWEQAPRSTFVTGVIAGLIAHAVVVAVAYAVAT